MTLAPIRRVRSAHDDRSPIGRAQHSPSQYRPQQPGSSQRQCLRAHHAGYLESVRDPSVSIIITNHNYAGFVEAAINSALAQDDDGICAEVIVVDDGSTDQSLAVIEAFADRVT